MTTENWFGSRLTACRERRGMSQVEFAESVGMKPAAINHFERGRRVPSLWNARKLARALGVTLDELVGDDGLEGRVASLERQVAALDSRTVGSIVFGGPRR